MTIEDIRDKIIQIVDLYSVKKVSLIGTHYNGRVEVASIDLIVEFAIDSISHFHIDDMKMTLEDIIGKEVDIIHAPVNVSPLIEQKETVLFER